MNLIPRECIVCADVIPISLKTRYVCCDESGCMCGNVKLPSNICSKNCAEINEFLRLHESELR